MIEYTSILQETNNTKKNKKKSYVDTNVKTSDQFVISQADASSAVMSSLSSDICSAKVIALINQPEVKR